MEKMNRGNIFIVLFLLLVVGVVIVGEAQRNENPNELIEAYGNASKVKYNPLTKTYSFGEYINISEDKLNQSIYH